MVSFSKAFPIPNHLLLYLKKIQKHTKTLVAILNASRVFGFPKRITSEVFQVSLNNIMIKNGVCLLFIYCHNVIERT